MNFSNKSELLDYLKSHGLWAKKSLSQNFLVDKEALDKIVGSADLKEDDLAVEIGPGLGVLTHELIQHAGKVIAIEMDDKLARLLAERAGEKLEVVNGDVLKLNLDEVIGNRSYKIVANIPYAITSKILQLFLSRKNKPESMTMLVQKEVAERVCARLGSMSILALSVQIYGQPEIVGIVPAESFFPAPKVDSAILKITSRKVPVVPPELEKEFFRCVHIGFASRRKTLVNNLSAGYRLPKEKVSGILEKMGLKDSIRAQELSIEQWKELCGKF